MQPCPKCNLPTFSRTLQALGGKCTLCARAELSQTVINLMENFENIIKECDASSREITELKTMLHDGLEETWNL